MIIGLTGGYCSGKSTVAALLAERGWRIVDVDTLGHIALEANAARVAGRFGPGVLGPDGRIARKALAAIVFSDPAGLADHEAIVHPAMLALLDAEISKARIAGADLCIDAALLYRFPQVETCDAVLEIRSPLCARLRRGRERDGISASKALARIRSQRPLWKLRPRKHPPVLFLRNSGSRTRLAGSLDRHIALIERPQTLK